MYLMGTAIGTSGQVREGPGMVTGAQNDEHMWLNAQAPPKIPVRPTPVLPGTPPQSTAGASFPASRMPRSVSTRISSNPPITKKTMSAKIAGR